MVDVHIKLAPAINRLWLLVNPSSVCRQPLAHSATIFQAIQAGQRAQASGPEVASEDPEREATMVMRRGRRLWDEVHTVHYCR